MAQAVMNCNTSDAAQSFIAYAPSSAPSPRNTRQWPPAAPNGKRAIFEQSPLFTSCGLMLYDLIAR